MQKTVYVSNGIGVFSLLGILFVGLKLCGVIDWSWWLVTLPFWGGTALCFAIVLLYLVGGITIAVIRALVKWTKEKLHK